MWGGPGMMPGMAPPPGMMMPGMGLPGGGQKSAEQLEKYTVFVSKIGDLNDVVMSRLLGLCGTVLSWKRPKDTMGKVKGFGVCEYAGPEATMRAMRLLHSLQVDTFTMMLKLSADMEQKVQDYQARVAAMQAQPGFETPSDRQMRDQAIRQQVLYIAGEHTTAQVALRDGVQRLAAGAAAQAGAPPPGVAAGPAGAPPPGIAAAGGAAPSAQPAPAQPSPPQPELSQADRFLGGLIGSSGTPAAPDGHVAGTNLIVKRSSNGGRSPSPARSEPQRRSRREEEDDRLKDREFRERERRWEERERQQVRDREREKDRVRREAGRAKEAGGKIEETILDEDEDVEEGRRGAGDDRQRRRKVRRRLREQELREDADDERREKSEAGQAKRDAERDAERAAQPQPAVGKGSAGASSGPAARVEQPPPPPGFTGPMGPSMGPAMMGPAGPSLPLNLGPAGPMMPAGPMGPASPQSARSGSSISIKTAAKPDAKSSKPKKSAFAVEEEEVKKKRKLVKLEYSADEIASQPGGGGAVDAARSAAAAAAKMINNKRGRGGSESAAERAKRLIGNVPKEKKELYAYAVDWAVLESAAIFQKKLEPWIARKVTEYFGERDETVISFVMEELEKHSSATEMIENLGPILESDCDDFVFKMWRMVIFEMLDQQDLLA